MWKCPSNSEHLQASPWYISGLKQLQLLAYGDFKLSCCVLSSESDQVANLSVDTWMLVVAHPSFLARATSDSHAGCYNHVPSLLYQGQVEPGSQLITSTMIP